MKKWIAKLMILTLLFALAGCEEDDLNVPSEGSVKGTVTNISGDAITSVNVTISFTDGNTTTTTNELGNYSFKGLPSKGDANITLVKEGYLTVYATVQLADTEVTRDFTLSENISLPPSTSSVNGVIKDISGNPLSGVNVRSGLVQTVTNNVGEYSLSVETGEKVSITADLENYAQASRNVEVIEDVVSNLDMTMVVVDKIEVFDVRAGATIYTKGATVALAGSSIVNNDGSTFIGEVIAKVSFNQVTSLSGQKVFPGDYIGLQTDGQESGLISYGFIDVTLEDANGSKLRLADGFTATLTYPMDTNIAATPDTIPLWYYDTEKGIWIEDGFASYDVNTNSYTGAVSHFTTWNLDAKVARGVLNGCVEDVNGNRVSQAQILLSTPGSYNTFNNNNANGEFGFYNAPAGQTLSLRATTGALSSTELILTLEAGETKTLSNCLVLDQGIIERHSITGRMLLGDGTPLTNQYLNITSNGLYLGGVQVDANGNLSDGDFNRPDNNIITISDNLYINGNSVYFEKSFTLNPNNEITNLGIIEIKTTTVSGCVQRVDGSRLFDLIDLKLNSPFGNEFANIDSNGNFNFIIAQDFAEHKAYVFTDPNYVHTLSLSINANKNVIDFGMNCLILENALSLNQPVQVSITTSSNKSILVKYKETADYEYPNSYGETILQNAGISASFNLTKNGVYYIYQNGEQNTYQEFDGTISVSVDGQTNTITIPQGVNTYENWVGQAIEVYQGQIKIIELNKPTEQPS